MQFLSKIWLTIQIIYRAIRIATQSDESDNVLKDRLRLLENRRHPLSKEEQKELNALECFVKLLSSENANENDFDALKQIFENRLHSLRHRNNSQTHQDELEKNELEKIEEVENYLSNLLSPSGTIPRGHVDGLINKISRCTDFNNEELSREVFQLFSYLDSSIAQEDNLLGQRLNLFLVAQTFLIAGYIQSFTLPTLIVLIPFTPFTYLSNSLAFAIATIGCLTSIASNGSVRLSIQAIEYYQKYYIKLKDEFSKSSYDFSPRPFKNRVSLYFGHYPDIYFDHKKQAKFFAKYTNWLNWTTIFFIFVWFILLMSVFWIKMPPIKQCSTSQTTQSPASQTTRKTSSQLTTIIPSPIQQVTKSPTSKPNNTESHYFCFL